MENPIKIDDLGVPLFSETSIYQSHGCELSRWVGWVGFLDRSSGGALWERFESEKKAQERNAGVEALGPGKNAEEILGYTN